MTSQDQNPEYFLASFPRHDFPRYQWETPPQNLPTQVWTTETTHRDGQQGGLPLTTAQSLEIYDLLCAFTHRSGAIRQAEFFVYRPSDRAALKGALERFASGAPIEPTTWIRATRNDVELIKNLGVRETGMLASASDYHTFHKFSPGNRAQAAHLYLEAVDRALDAGLIFLLRQHRKVDLSKEDPRLQPVLDWVTAQFDGGRQTGIEWEELQPVLARHLDL